LLIPVIISGTALEIQSIEPDYSGKLQTMNQKKEKDTSFLRYKNHKIFMFILILVLILGVFLRFVNIDKKAYWDDEAFTSLRVSGYKEYELVEQVASVNKVSVGELSQYQNLNPQKNLIDTIQSLASEDPQHPPLYYIITWFWVHLFGSSIASFRIVSALISLIALPGIYWLCWELFASPLTASIAAVFIAISPFHVLYAQEAREYSLWTVMILLSSASLLYANRLNTKSSWGIYTAVVTFSLYTFPSSIIVTLAQGVYLAIRNSFRPTQQLLAYVLASVTAFLAFTPWLMVIMTNLSHINKTVGGQGNMSRIALVKTWAFNISRIFIDSNNEREVINFGFENSFTFLIQILLVCLLVFLSAYSIYFLCRHSSRESWLLIITLISVTSLPIMLKDLVEGGTRSIILRYLTPAYLGIQISIAHLISEGLICKKNWQKLGKIFICVLLSGSIVSCLVSAQATSWWTKSHSDINIAAAKLINQSHHPLIVSDGSMGMILGLSHELNPQVQLQLKPYCHTCIVTPSAVSQKRLFPVPDGFDVFLFDPSAKLIQEVKAYPSYKIDLVGVDIWRLQIKK